MLSVFRLQPTSKPSAPTTTPTFSSCIGTLGLDIPERNDTPIDHPTVAAPQTEAPTSELSEDITHDTQQQQQQRPTHEWNSLDEFYMWRMIEELDHGVELHLVRRKYSSGNGRWRENRTYVCSRQGTGGKSKYIRKKHDDGIKTRSTGCRCRLVIQIFHHVPTVLGWYKAKHNHHTQVASPMFTRLRESTRVHIVSHLRRRMNTEVSTRERKEHREREPGHYIIVEDEYGTTVKREEVALSMLSDQLSNEHSEGSPARDEGSMIRPEDDGKAGSSQADEDPEVSDERANGCTNSSAPTSPSLSGSASPQPQFYTPVPTPGVESAAPSVVPTAQVTHHTAPPALPPHNIPGPYYLPQPPLVVYLTHPPYQMTFYPVYPAYFPMPAF